MTRSYVGAIAVVLAAAPARADDREATCDRLRAEARAEALLLYAPRLEATAAHSPKLVDVIDPSLPAVNFQARVGLGVSPTDMLQGRALERIASAECMREQASSRLESVLALGARIGELAATRAELAVLRARMGDVDAIVNATASRVEHQRGTAIELADVRSRRAMLRRHTAELEHARAMLEQIDRDPAPLAVGALAEQYRDAMRTVDRRKAALREVHAWRVDVRGGVAGGERADWFAVVEVGYSLGGPWQAGANHRASRARERELATDRHSLAARLDELLRMLRESIATLGVELAELDEELTGLRAEHERLATLDGDGARGLRDRITLELVSIEARRAHVAALLAARRPYLQELR